MKKIFSEISTFAHFQYIDVEKKKLFLEIGSFSDFKYIAPDRNEKSFLKLALLTFSNT